jgi:polysaccharide chain length determinant protein (PEP-CTERM system associated)
VLPGKKYTPEEVVEIVWRRKWLIVVPFVICAVSTVLIANRLPKRYRSETVILVVPQRVPESYVKSTVTSRIEDRLTSLREQILSRSRLERVITDLNLYQDLRRKLVMEDVVDAMRRDIDVKVERGDSFRVSYTSGVPETAQKVTARLAQLFIDENVKDRTVQAESTNQFLDVQLNEARDRLLSHEKKLEDYKKQFSGELPTQAPANIQAIQSAQLQLQSLRESIDRDRDHRLVLERQRADLETMTEPSLPTTPVADQPVSTAEQLEAAQSRLRAMELRYKPEHPDVKAQKSLIHDLEAKLQREVGQSLQDKGALAALTPAEMARRNRVRDLTIEIQNIDNQLERKRSQDRELQESIASYQAKLNAAPTREAELTALMRDYETLRNAYTGLLAKREESKMAANLERNQSGEQFKVLDAARVPERPASPKVPLIDAAGAAFGLGIGVLLVGFLEYRDSTFKTEGEIEQLLQLPVLALVPLMASQHGSLNRPRGKVAALSIGVILVGSAVGAFWKLQIF